jgi:hypothetical protein
MVRGQEEWSMTPSATSNSKRLLQVVLAICLFIAADQAEAAHRPKPGQVVSVQVFTSNSIDDRSVPGGTTITTKLPAPLFTYTKQRETSVLKVTYQDTLGSSSQSGPGTPCYYQLRIDDTSSQPGDLFSAPILIVYGNIFSSFSSTGVFTGLPAGPHELSIWLSVLATGPSTECIQNVVGRSVGGSATATAVIVEEVEPLQ